MAQKGRQAALVPRARVFVTVKKCGARSIICTGNVLCSGFGGTFSTLDPILGKCHLEPLGASQIHLVADGKQKDKAFNFTHYGPTGQRCTKVKVGGREVGSGEYRCF